MALTDNTLATANNLGTLSNTVNIADVIGGTDPVSYYRFTLSANSDISGAVDWATGSGNPAFLRLVVDFNGNGFVENNERIRTLSAGADTSFFQSLPTGTYYSNPESFMKWECGHLARERDARTGNFYKSFGIAISRSRNQ